MKMSRLVTTRPSGTTREPWSDRPLSDQPSSQTTRWFVPSKATAGSCCSFAPRLSSPPGPLGTPVLLTAAP
jgi:hypothetical protein